MEISPQHHSIVVGTHHENLKQIIMRTGAKILFPDATDPNIPPLKRSNVTISGGIHNVFLARQQLIVRLYYNVFIIFLNLYSVNMLNKKCLILVWQAKPWSLPNTSKFI